MKIYADGMPSKENPSGMGCYMVLSGKGCDDYLNHKKNAHAFGYFFQTLDLHFKIRRGGYHLTRLDIAIDDKNDPPYFTIKQIKKKCERDEFVSLSRSHGYHESTKDTQESAKTVYIGDRKSNISYRFYDKDKEQCGKYQIPYIGNIQRAGMKSPLHMMTMII